MKKYLLISLLVLTSLLLLSCAKKEQAPAVPEEVLPLSEQLAEYTIVYPDCMGTYVEKFTVERYSALRLKTMIKESFGITLTAQSDSNTAAAKEIIIGNARGTAVSDMGEGYSVAKNGDNITISAGGIYSYSQAFTALLTDLNNNAAIPETISLSEENTIKPDTEKDFVYIDMTDDQLSVPEYAVKSLSIGGIDISNYKIIYHVWGTPSDPHYGLNEQYAAEQLQKYIMLATGIELPIETDEAVPADYEIVVGITNREGNVINAIDRSSYGEEDTLIRNEGTRLIISGAERRGTIYAAYTFLEKYLGIRFYAVDCEVIYKSESIDISNVDYKHVSDLEFRDSNQKTIQIGEFASKRKVNSNFRRVMNYKQGGTFDFATSEFPHTMSTVLKLENAPGFAQPCLTDEATYQKALENTLTLLSRKPDAKLVSVTQNDNAQYCACASCLSIIKEERSEAAPLIRFINRLADDVAKEYPDVRILTFAYMHTVAPCQTAPRDNVVIMYCPIDSCCACALNDPDCQTNHRFAEYIEGWAEMTDNLYIWYYVAEYTQNDMLPFMDFDAIYENYQYFRSLGVKGIFNQGWMNDEGNEFDVMRAYVLSLLMWDPDITYEEYNAAIEDFIDAYYGEASEVVMEYYHTLTTLSQSQHFTQYSSVKSMFDTSVFSEIAPELDSWWEEINAYEYSSDWVADRISRLYRGYIKVKSFL